MQQPKHIRDTLIIFAEAMDKKLRRDDATKPAWETEVMWSLVGQLNDEILELQEALRDYHLTANDPDGKALMLECVDVANQAMTIFSQIHPLTRHNRRGHALHKIPSSVEPPNPDFLPYESWTRWRNTMEQTMQAQKESWRLNETILAEQTQKQEN